MIWGETSFQPPISQPRSVKLRRPEEGTLLPVGNEHQCKGVKGVGNGTFEETYQSLWADVIVGVASECHNNSGGSHAKSYGICCRVHWPGRGRPDWRVRAP